MGVREIAVEILSNVLGLEPEEVSPGASIKNTQGWDSFSHLELCEEISNRTNVDVTDDLVEECTTLEGIINFLDKSSRS